MYSLPVLQQMMKKIAKQYAGSGGGSEPQAAFGAIDVQLNVQLIKNAFRDAEANQKSRYQDGNMVVDVFTDLSGIELLQSNNVALLDGTITQLETDVAPHNMTNSVTPAPYKATASNYDSGAYPHQTFDGNYISSNFAWATDTGVTQAWIRLDLGEGNEKQVRKYAIVAWNISRTGVFPKDWTFEGSMDGVSWTVLDTRTGETNWSPGEKRLYNFENSRVYRFYRLNISANNGGNQLGIQELEFYHVGTGEIEFPTKVVNTVKSPTRLIIVPELMGSAKFDVSLDNGVSWLGDVPANTLIDVSMLTGTELIIKVTLSDPGTLYSLGFIWYSDLFTPMNMQQITKLNIEEILELPYMIEIPIPQTSDFLMLPPSVLKFIPDQDDLVRTFCDFQQDDQMDFEQSPYIGYDNGMYLKTLYEESFTDVADTNYSECNIDTSIYTSIETIKLIGGE